jgi:hypothetical protein
MKRVSKDASVHESTVKDAAKKAAAMPKRRRQVRDHAPNLAVVHTQMHDEVWTRALGLADGDRHRIQVLNDEDVIVHNNRAWKDA